jgi:formate C-acetyltransferase
MPDLFPNDDIQSLAETISGQKRAIYDREMNGSRGLPVVVRMARAFSCFLAEKDIAIDGYVLAGFLQFSDSRWTNPLNMAEEYALWKEDHGRDEPLLAAFLLGEAEGLYNRCPGGHVIAGYRMVLEKGLGCLAAEADAALHSAGPDNTHFLRAAAMTCRAVSSYILRYAGAADALASKGGPFESLSRAAAASRKVAFAPAESFFEAVQLLVLVHEAVTLEQRSGSLSLGRLDKMLAPYYDRDIASGALRKAEAEESAAALWRRLALMTKGFQNVTLGGWDSEKGYFFHPLTSICLNAAAKTAKDQPLLSLRCHPCMPRELWEQALDLLGTGLGFPALFNDDVCIPAKTWAGVSRGDAEDYGIIGCVELSAGGREYAHTEALRISWAKILENMLREEAGKPAPPDFEHLLLCYLENMRKVCTGALAACSLLDANYPEHWPSPFLSATMDGCVQKGRDVTAGGTVYNLSAVNAAGMANAVDSLLALKKFVYDEKRFTMAYYMEMLDADYEGYEEERACILANCPRYGSDNEAADLMRRISGFFTDLCSAVTGARGGRYQVGYYSVESHGILGERTGALPDGRKRGTALSNGFSPVQGTERNGPTGVINASVRTDHARLANGMVLDMKFSTAFFKQQNNRDALEAMIKTYFKLGGMELQLNVVDKETLLDAQRNPQSHRNLIVRVSGFSAYFVSLSDVVQREIIARTEIA